MMKNNIKPDPYCLKIIASIYVETGKITAARKLLNQMKEPSVKINNMDCTQLVQAFARCGQTSGAVEILDLMAEKSVQPDRTTFVTLLKSCADTGDLTGGTLVHTRIIER